MDCENRFEANDAQYKSISILGRCCGNIGTVHLAKYLPTAQLVALKRINLDKAKQEIPLVEHEIILTRQLQHANIIQYLSVFVSGVDVCIVTPLMGFGTCRTILNNHFNDGLPENAIAIILRDVLSAVEYIHKRGIIHRAIRASHVLVSANGTSSLSGFRYSCPIVRHGKWQKSIHSFPQSTSINLNWLSPELIQQNLLGYNEKSDLYSVGMFLSELANGTEPFSGVQSIFMLTEKMRGSAPQLLDCTTIDASDNNRTGDNMLTAAFRRQAQRRFSETLHDVAALCLQRDPDDRPSAGQLLAHHPFFKQRRSATLPSDNLPEFLKPAMPYTDNMNVCDTDEMENYENMQKISDLEIYSCDWDF